MQRGFDDSCKSFKKVDVMKNKSQSGEQGKSNYRFQNFRGREIE